MVLLLRLTDSDTRSGLGTQQYVAEIEARGFPMIEFGARAQAIGAADHFADAAEAERSHQFAYFLCHVEEEANHVFGFAHEFFTQDRVLCRHSHRAGVEVALAHHDASGCNERRGGKTKLLGTE